MYRPPFLLLTLLFLGFTSCELPHDEVYEEPITSALFVLTPDSGTTAVLQYMDSDGIGGQPAIVSRGYLLPNTTYQCKLMLNTIGKHIIDSTSIAQEQEIHQVFFLTQSGLDLRTEYMDVDANGFPVGLKSTITTGSSSSGTLMVIIQHNPNKSAQGVASGKIEEAGGSADLEVSFDVAIR